MKEQGLYIRSVPPQHEIGVWRPPTRHTAAMCINVSASTVGECLLCMLRVVGSRWVEHAFSVTALKACSLDRCTSSVSSFAAVQPGPASSASPAVLCMLSTDPASWAHLVSTGHHMQRLPAARWRSSAPAPMRDPAYCVAA